MTLTIPRDRAGTFDPKLIAKYQRRFCDFDDKILSMCARGMIVREIQGHLEEIYGIEVTPDLISTVTDKVLEAVGERQNRPLDLLLPRRVLRRHPCQDQGRRFCSQQRRLCRTRRYGRRQQGNPRALDRADHRSKVLARVMNELKSRGCQDILIAVVDGLKGVPVALTAVFPQTIVQICFDHLIRHSLEFVSCKDRKPVVPALRAIYSARDAEVGLKALEAFEQG